MHTTFTEQATDVSAPLLNERICFKDGRFFIILLITYKLHLFIGLAKLLHLFLSCLILSSKGGLLSYRKKKFKSRKSHWCVLTNFYHHLHLINVRVTKCFISLYIIYHNVQKPPTILYSYFHIIRQANPYVMDRHKRIFFPSCLHLV